MSFGLGVRHWFLSLLALLAVFSVSIKAGHAQTAGTLYTFPTGTSDWFRNFGAANTSATLTNSSGSLLITETSTVAGGSQAFSDGFNTIRDTPATFAAGCCGGLDLTGLSSLQFDLGHNGVSPVDVQFFTQATPGGSFIALGPDISVLPGMNTYTVPISGLTPDQITYMRTIGMNVRDHASQGNLTWTLGEVRSAGASLTSRVIADHEGDGDFDGAICNFDCGAISGGNGGQNNSGMAVVAGSLRWTDLGGGPGAAVTWGNGTQNSGGSFNTRPVDLSNYDFVTIRMSASGSDSSLGIQFYMQTGSGFIYQALNDSLIVDGAFHDLVLPLAGITGRDYVDTNGINLFAHGSDLVINVDSVIYSQGSGSVPEPSTVLLLFAGLAAAVARRRAQR